MRGAMLFVLLALVLPTAAFASSVDLTSDDFHHRTIRCR